MIVSAPVLPCREGYRRAVAADDPGGSAVAAWRAVRERGIGQLVKDVRLSAGDALAGPLPGRADKRAECARAEMEFPYAPCPHADTTTAPGPRLPDCSAKRLPAG